MRKIKFIHQTVFNSAYIDLNNEFMHVEVSHYYNGLLKSESKLYEIPLDRELFDSLINNPIITEVTYE